MEEPLFFSEPIYVEDAINITSGTRRYQKLVICILSLGTLSVSSIFMNIQYFLPLKEKTCTQGPGPSYCSNSYQKTASYDLNISEDQEITKLATFCLFSGAMLGSLIIPWLSDRWGRLKIIKKCCFGAAVSFVIFILSINQIMLLGSMFLIGLLSSGFFTMSFVLCSEILDFKHRNLYLGLFYASWNVFSLCFTLIFVLEIISWRCIFLISTISILIELILLRYLLESPRFLLTNLADAQGAIAVFEKISVINDSVYFPYALIPENIEVKPRVSVSDLCNSKLISIKLFASGVFWFIVELGYSNAVVNMPAIESEGYLVSIGINIAEAISLLFTILIMEHIGRKKVLFFSCVFNGIAFVGIGILTLNSLSEEIMVIVFGIEKCILAGDFYLLYLYTAEIFPTHMRASAFGICNAVGYAAVLIVPYLENSSYQSKFTIVIGLLMLFSSGLSTLLRKELDQAVETNQPLLTRNNTIE